MENKILLFKPIFLQKLWGSNYLKNKHKTNLSNVGEMWSLSALRGQETICLNSIYKDKNLSEIYKISDIFGDKKSDQFPLLIKLLTTKKELSIQVHPDDNYAKKNEQSLGKDEGWLILKNSFNSRILLSHKLNTKTEIKDMVENKNYKNNLNYIFPKRFYFYPIPSRTLHALGKNIVLLEIQQSSDVTYRVYDYDRVDNNGIKRELHLSKALDCISPHPYSEKVTSINSKENDSLWINKHFKVAYQKVRNQYTFKTFKKYLIGTIAKGIFFYDGYKITEGESFIVPVNCHETIKGNGIIVLTEER